MHPYNNCVDFKVKWNSISFYPEELHVHFIDAAPERLVTSLTLTIV